MLSNMHKYRYTNSLNNWWSLMRYSENKFCSTWRMMQENNINSKVDTCNIKPIIIKLTMTIFFFFIFQYIGHIGVNSFQGKIWSDFGFFIKVCYTKMAQKMNINSTHRYLSHDKTIIRIIPTYYLFLVQLLTLLRYILK